jgi:hypothetical protein
MTLERSFVDRMGAVLVPTLRRQIEPHNGATLELALESSEIKIGVNDTS